VYANSTIDDGKLHIFVVSSGLLYERLQRIMILSVLKHTKTPVKFWILENFVSPQYRELLPRLSQKYRIEYSFVSYAWPTWLPSETARERIIWGYKILFLDVMFPNNLKRVIYIDSDDVARTDLAELMTLDLEGASYAFTPFCEDRPEMEEYRFWNDGYWRNLLNGKKYHISALFVVDLVQLRKRETGDFIRKAYQDLFGDKLSLWNLDQDLPNLLQDKGAKIFSLPQEWLWCGTWCSDETMEKAKVIDMCNNPKTKIGKLEYAKANIAEWTTLDDEINAPGLPDDL
jgi:UDP-glucose:glycoprotein glucosyltransferase